MTNVEIIKNQIMEMQTKLNELNTQVQTMNNNEYVFTKEQLIKFVKEYTDGLESYIKKQIEDMEFDEDMVHLDLNDKTIELSIDSYEIAREINRSIEFIDDEELEDAIHTFYKQVKSNS